LAMRMRKPSVDDHFQPDQKAECDHPPPGNLKHARAGSHRRAGRIMDAHSRVLSFPEKTRTEKRLSRPLNAQNKVAMITTAPFDRRDKR
jgi:hypothetical protein